MKTSEKWPEDKRILAGIVLYNPEMELLKKNIDALQPQVDQIVFVDNHSENLAEILALAKERKIRLIRNSSNLGIAKALNQILESASQLGYNWYLTMDQDSIVSENLIEEYKKAMHLNPGILCPYLLNNQKMSKEEYEALELPEFQQIEDPILCITSAALNNTHAARDIGGYNEALFIDCVDVDFNIRMMEKYDILKANHACLIQAMGEGRRIAIFHTLAKALHSDIFRKLSVSPVYSDLRLYYIARNSKYIYQTYPDKCGRQMTPAWMMAQFVYYCLTYPKERSRKDMIKAIRTGLKDTPKAQGETKC